VASELRYGAAKRASARLSQQLNLILDTLDVVALESPTDEIYGAIRTKLEKSGKPIGGNDLLIAAHAIALDSVLVTDNEREFSRVDGLTRENWLR
jgi:tRNA(fMet)-specific endonuclease VapC